MALLPSGPPSTSLVDRWSSEPNLDLLRGFAVLCVVVRHVLGLFPIGAQWWFNLQALGIFGVLIFFVHTSLVLMVSLHKLRRAPGSRTTRLWAAFIVRRLFRIYPLSVTVVLITYFVMLPAADDTATRAGITAGSRLGDLIANLFLVQDLTGNVSVLAPLWSLPAEVQMYLLLPFLFLAVERGGARMIAVVIWPLAVAVALATWKLDLRMTVGRYAPCFVAGVGCFAVLRDRRPLRFPVFPVGIVVLLLLYMAGYNRFGFQAGLGIIATACLAGIIPLCASMQSVRSQRISRTIAKYSYGIYLFHAPCIWLAFGKWRALGAVGSTICLVLLIAAMSVAAFHLIEDPLIRVGRGLANRIMAGSLGATGDVELSARPPTGVSGPITAFVPGALGAPPRDVDR